MSKNIEWKSSSFDDDKLNKLNELSHNDLQRHINGVNAAKTGQLLPSRGGKVGGAITYKNGVGLFGMSKEDMYKTKVNGGKVSGKLAVERRTVVKAGIISAQSPKHPNNILVKCEHCGKECNLALNRRWHGDNCKNNPNKKTA